MMRMLILFVGATDLGWKIRGWNVFKSKDDRSVDGLRRWTVVEDLGLIVPWMECFASFHCLVCGVEDHRSERWGCRRNK